ncbi:hypothetical protein Metho_1179 [Methanomethylovorans hollandica DSM 15978]|uniref:Uncharacterized protein n=1 Tax=Methanomethylovorans hollandica (strain DSM 15978 / NBRC 107637 / DMS1) TaxID=867904 RepID=L0KWA4_METHD|nr:hypothetical protein [Methanomethylovorans hollandica]AGB49411.1 hypothetical protein Metho_1179 [Methanomethylovorans hollandica DSM 15978]
MSGVTIEYDEWLNALLDVYRFRISILNEHLSSMPVKTKENGSQCHQLECQLLALKEIFSELEARGTQGRTTIENDADQSKITLT